MNRERGTIWSGALGILFAVFMAALLVVAVIGLIAQAKQNIQLHEDWVAGCVEAGVKEARAVDPYADVDRQDLERQCEVRWQAEIWPQIQQAQKPNVHYVVTSN